MGAPNSLARELTLGSSAEFRRIEAGAEWASSLAQAVRGTVAESESIDWPLNWQVFSNGCAANPSPDIASCLAIPHTLRLGDTMAPALTVSANSLGVLDLATAFGPPRSGKLAVLFAWVSLDQPALVHAGADWWMRWWVDGKPVFDTLARGNGGMLADSAHEFSIDPGRHLLAVEVLSGNGGWAFASEATTRPDDIGGCDFELEGRRFFSVHDAEVFQEVSVGECGDKLPFLNGSPILPPIPGMRFRSIPIPVSALQVPGLNVVSHQWSIEESRLGTRFPSLKFFRHSGPGKPIQMRERIWGHPPSDLRIETGPVVHSISIDSASISCRTNMAATLLAECEGQTISSPNGHLHRFDINGLRPGTRYVVNLRSTSGHRLLASRALNTLPSAAPLTFALVGDPSPVPKTWGDVSSRVADTTADFVVFLGDAVGDGRDDWRWNEEFFLPASAMFSRFPVFGVPGNHDENSPFFSAFFGDRNGQTNWSQRWNQVLLIGMDGAADWSPGSSNNAWLRAVLTRNRGAFVMLFDHYPPFSSTGHGEEDADGHPIEPPMRTAREILLPLLIDHGPGVLISGHAHCYERSELAPHLTLITTGGGGGYLYHKSDTPGRNPCSAIFESCHHYCLVSIERDSCSLRALATDGRLIDHRTWPLPTN